MFLDFNHMTIDQSDILPEVAATIANNVHVLAFREDGDLLLDDVEVLACRVRERDLTHKQSPKPSSL